MSDTVPLPIPCPCGFGSNAEPIWRGAEHNTDCPWYTAGTVGPEIVAIPLGNREVAADARARAEAFIAARDGGQS